MDDVQERLQRLEETIGQLAGLMSKLASGISGTGVGQQTGGAGGATEANKNPFGTLPQVTSGGNSIESYIARAGQFAMMGAAAGAGAQSAFTIEVRFLGGLTDNQKNAFKTAANRWTRAIVGAVPAVSVEGEVVRGLLILAQGANIDGPGRILGQAGPTRLRPANGSAPFIPAKGEMTFDSADLRVMEQQGTLGDVITHEMGHVLGIGSIWSQKALLNGAHTSNPTFTGQNAAREYGVLRGGGSMPVPVENTGGQGTADSHWRESVFANELMTGFVGAAGNPMSRLTIASLQDVGYTVDMNAAEPYQLPSHLALAEAGGMPMGALEMGTMLPHIPIVLPEGSLQ
jgi:hypothetical protein